MKNSLINEEGAYVSKDFVELFRGVVDGSIPVETLLEHKTYVRRGHQICAHYAPKQYEEVFQELSLRIYLNMHRLSWINDEEEFFRWASKVARNIAIDMFRASQRQGEIDDTPVENHIICDTTIPNPDLVCDIQRWLASLSPLRRRIVQLCIENPGISTREIAGLLAEEGFTRSHAAVAKDLNETRKSFLKKVGGNKRAHTRSA